MSKDQFNIFTYKRNKCMYLTKLYMYAYGGKNIMKLSWSQDVKKALVFDRLMDIGVMNLIQKETGESVASMLIE